MKRILLLLIFIFLSAPAVNAQIYRVAEMNTDQIRTLDRQKTVVILPGGILEEHGPHLPSFSDGFMNDWLAQKLAETIVERPGWTVLMFPIIPLGHEGANEIAARHVFPGTYSVRRSTLRAVFMDLATELGEQGFRWIFVVHGHGAPFHNLMLDEAGDYFRDIYGGRMVHLRGLLPTDAQLAALKIPAPPDLGLTEADRKEVGVLDEHAGYEETSRIMFLYPNLVAPIVKELPPQTTNNFDEFFGVARAAGWRGYLSSPRLSNASYGARALQYRSLRDNALALAILDGKLDERDVPRYSKMMTGNKDIMTALAASARNDAERTRRQEEWLKKKGYE